MKVIVSAPLPGPALRELQSTFDVVLGAAPTGLGHQGLLATAATHPDAVALIPLVSDRVDVAVMDAFPDLRVIANYGVGVDNIALDAARLRGIAVTNTPDVLTDATADLTLALILMCSRRLLEGERLLRDHRWTGWSPTMLVGSPLAGQVLGIVGFGRIGRAVAQRARAFGMHVVACTHRAVPTHLDGLAEQRSLEDVLRISDVLSLHCSLNDSTRGLLNAANLRAMKRGAIVINTARGALLDEAALADALVDGHIAAAGLDVFANEPSIHPALLAAPNTVLLPHLGSADRTAREGMTRRACENIRAALRGEPLLNRVV